MLPSAEPKSHDRSSFAFLGPVEVAQRVQEMCPWWETGRLVKSCQKKGLFVFCDFFGRIF